MKMITAMIQPFMLDKVIDDLQNVENFPGVTITDARGFGRLQSEKERHAPHFDPFHKKVRLDIVASDEMAEEIVALIAARAHTGNHGDGKIFVWSVDNAIRVQTGETGEAAL